MTCCWRRRRQCYSSNQRARGVPIGRRRNEQSGGDIRSGKNIGESDGVRRLTGLYALCAPGQWKPCPGHPVTIPSQERKAAKGCCPWRNARVKLCPDERYPQPSAPLKSMGLCRPGDPPPFIEPLRFTSPVSPTGRGACATSRTAP